jgi:hypothetical protein
MAVFQMMVIDIPVCLRKKIDKLRRGFLWENKEVATGGKCLVSWREICRPTKYRGLGILVLQAQSIALRTRWLWMEWTDPSKPWQSLRLPIDAKMRQLFNASINFHLGNGEKIKFWTDPWLMGMSLANRAPALFDQCTRKSYLPGML